MTATGTVSRKEVDPRAQRCNRAFSSNREQMGRCPKLTILSPQTLERWWPQAVCSGNRCSADEGKGFYTRGRTRGASEGKADRYFVGYCVSNKDHSMQVPLEMCLFHAIIANLLFYPQACRQLGLGLVAPKSWPFSSQHHMLLHRHGPCAAASPHNSA